VRITISHQRSKAEVIESIDKSFDEIFQGMSGNPVRLTVQQRSWQGSTLNFTMAADMGLMSLPIQGTIEVTDQDVTVNVDLGLLERLLPQEKIREAVGNRIKGLLN
jgi:Putative polyhydroxyalkanoic acid system protein (PHA_gran_rgn)